ncbi:hypothetical protein AB0H70_29825, partial [Streptomyces sp. NPDC050804]
LRAPGRGAAPRSNGQGGDVRHNAGRAEGPAGGGTGGRAGGGDGAGGDGAGGDGRHGRTGTPENRPGPGVWLEAFTKAVNGTPREPSAEAGDAPAGPSDRGESDDVWGKGEQK